MKPLYLTEREAHLLRTACATTATMYLLEAKEPQTRVADNLRAQATELQALYDKMEEL